MTFIKTFTGRKFDYENISASNVDILDIGHALSHLCRFGGHTKVFYSVAQHCVLCATVAMNTYKDDVLAKYALMHDASEAYCVDIPRPLKRRLSNYNEIEAEIQSKILDKFNLLEYNIYSEKVREIDNRMLITEANYILNGGSKDFTDPICDPYEDMMIVPWTSEAAKKRFLITYSRLFNGLKTNDI